jgi:hypothetical protein
MPPAPTLQELIDNVRSDVPGDDALEHLAQASKTVGDLEQVSDALLGHFVDQCRRTGRSWSDISGALGVSKQAAHKRFSFVSVSFERFTPRARAVLNGAAEEADRLGHAFVGTEHLLLALFEPVESLAARLLSDLGITRSAAEDQVLNLIERGPGSDGAQKPFTPRAIEALRGAVEEALQLGHNYVGTEHILLALSREGDDAIAPRALVALGASHDTIKSRTIELLSGYRRG